MARVVTFGEVMGRLAPPGHLRFQQAMPGTLDMTFAGAEANVAVSIARLGGEASFVSALPEGPLADACIETLRRWGVDTRSTVRGEGRLGLYFLETGANQRPGRVVYDRDGSAIALAPAEAYAWDEALRGASWFHVSGITPAISRRAADATLAAVRAARASGATVSCDLNFRKKLWRWEKGTPPRELAERTMRQVLAHVDLVIANEEDAAMVLSIEARETDVEAGRLAVDAYPEVAREIERQFPQVSRVAITLRESISASHNDWGAMVHDARRDSASFAPLSGGEYAPYEIRDIVDRVGAGDAFAAALIFAFLTPELSEPARAVSFAAAASCLAHSIVGDFNLTTRDEVEALLRGGGSGRVVR